MHESGITLYGRAGLPVICALLWLASGCLAAAEDTDTDDDGLSDLLEFLQGLDPNDPESKGEGITRTNLEDAEYRLNLGPNFADVDYLGAFAQDRQDNWTLGWTVAVNGNNTVWAAATGGTLGGSTPAADGSCPAGTSPAGETRLPGASGRMDFCRLPQRFAVEGGTLRLTNDNIYLLGSGFPGTYIGNGEADDGNRDNDVESTLVIEAGTLLLGDEEEALIVTRGSDVFIRGTEEDPVVMSSRIWFDDWLAGGDGTSDRGEWAGFAIMGYAASNECGVPCDVAAEGNIGAYGGADDADDSGDLRYLVIRHAGNDIDGNGNELNGFTLFAAGSGTRSSYVQVHKGQDDGVEHFGGTDHMDHLVLTANRDDSFDWGQGYRGTAQFVLILQAADDADRGIEADNDGDNPDLVPVSRPTLANFTILGHPDGDSGADGILLRRGTGARLHNFVVAGFADACIQVDGADTLELFGSDLTISRSLLDCRGDADALDTGDENPALRDIEAWWRADPLNMQLPANLAANGQPGAAEGLGNTASDDIVLTASILPYSRSVAAGAGPATVWASVRNSGTETAEDCMVAMRSNLDASFSYRTLDSAGSQITGAPAMRVNLPPASPGSQEHIQNYLLVIDPQSVFAATETEFDFECRNTDPAEVIPGMNTLLLSAPPVAGPDIIALPATASDQPGVVIFQRSDYPGGSSILGNPFFALATTNVGSSGSIRVVPEPAPGLPLAALICETTGGAACIGRESLETEMAAGATATFSVFLSASDTMNPEAADGWVAVRFMSGDRVVGAARVLVSAGYTAAD